MENRRLLILQKRIPLCALPAFAEAATRRQVCLYGENIYLEIRLGSIQGIYRFKPFSPGCFQEIVIGSHKGNLFPCSSLKPDC